MANRIAGITIEIGGDTKKLQTALKGVDSQLKTTQSKLKDVNKLLKLDPGNTQLLTQKQKLLKEAIGKTSDRLKTLKSVQKDSLKPDEWDALQREIVETEQNLKDLKTEYQKFGTVSAQKLKATGSQLQQTGKNVTKFGTDLTKYVTLPIVGVGTAAYAAFNEVDEGMDTIITKTGATGDALDDMGKIMEEIATELPTSFAEAGEAVGEVNTRFGVTGDELKSLSTQYIQFCKLNDTDLTGSVDASQKALAAFGLGADDASGYLDTLTLVAQQTGVSVDTLMAGAVANSTAFKEMGLSLNDATVFMGQLEVSGADSSAVMGGLSKALKNATAEGKPLDVALAELQDTIKNGTGTTDGLTAAYDLFGKSGAQVFELVKSGALDFTDLADASEDASGTVTDTFNATLDPADQFQMALNGIKATGAAIAEVVMPLLSDILTKVKNIVLDLKEKWDGLDEGQQKTILTIAGIIAAAGPLIAMVGTIVTGIGGLISTVGGLIGAVGGLLPGGLIIVGLIAAGKLIYDHWDEIKAWVVDTFIPAVKKAWEDLKDKVSVVFEAIKGFWENTLKPAVQALWKFIVDTVVPKVVEAWGDFKTTAAAVFAAVKNFWDNTLKPALDALWKFIVETVVPKAEEAWNSFKNTVSTVFANIKNFWENTLKPAIDALWKFIVETVVPKAEEAWNSLKDTVSTVFASIKNFWDNTLKPAIDALWKFIVETVVPKAEEAWNSLKDTVSVVFASIKNFWDTVLKPAVDAIWKFICETVVPKAEEAWNSLKGTVSTVFDAIKGFWENTLKPAFEAIKTFLEETLKPIFENTFNAIKDIVDIALKAIDDLWNNTVKPIYNGIVDFFSGIFHADMETAWNGIEELIDGVWNGITTTADAVWEAAKKWGTTLWSNFKTFFDNGWNLIKDDVLGVWDNITNKAEEIWESAKDWGISIFNNFKESIKTGWENIKQWFENLWDEIKAIPQKLIDAALNWGADMINNFKAGIEQKWEDLKQGISDIGTGIANLLGFSVPKEGPLSDADTWMPDMIDLLVKGVNDSAHLITTTMGNLVNNIKVAFKLAGSGAYTEFNQALNGYSGNQMTDAITGPINSAMYTVQHMNWRALGWHVKDTFLEGLNGLYESVKRAFDFSNIYVKTPHWSVRRWNEISGSYYPDMEVKWYRRAYDNPVMFTNPTVLGTGSGLKGFGDGPGGEVVLSADKLRQIVGEAGDVTINVYTQPGQDARQIAQEVQRIMVREQQQRSAAYA